MNPVPAPTEDGEREGVGSGADSPVVPYGDDEDKQQRTPSDIIKDITSVRLPNPFGRGGASA